MRTARIDLDRPDIWQVEAAVLAVTEFCGDPDDVIVDVREDFGWIAICGRYDPGRE